MSFHEIVVGMDFFPSSLLALRVARSLAADGATIHIVHSSDVRPLEILLNGPSLEVSRLHEELLNRSPRHSNSKPRASDAAALHETASVRAGRPADEILALAGGADLMTVGSHGHGMVGRALVGSVADELARRSTIPVLIVRGWSEDDAPQFERVVVAVDLANPARDAIRLAGDVARDGGLGLEALHVVPRPAMTPAGFLPSILPSAPVPAFFRSVERVQAHLERVPGEVARLVADVTGREPKVRLVVGRVGREIRRYMRPHDLLVCGTHSRSGVARFFFGSVAARLIHGAPCSVLVVRPHEAGRRTRGDVASFARGLASTYQT